MARRSHRVLSVVFLRAYLLLLLLLLCTETTTKTKTTDDAMLHLHQGVLRIGASSLLVAELAMVVVGLVARVLVVFLCGEMFETKKYCHSTFRSESAEVVGLLKCHGISLARVVGCRCGRSDHRERFETRT
jgi:hypothetical protein